MKLAVKRAACSAGYGKWQRLGRAATAATVLAVLVSGCVAFHGKEDYQDPKKSLLVAYLRVDGYTDADWIHLRHPGGDDDAVLMAVGPGGEQPGECVLFAGAADSGVYEIQTISAQRSAYKFPPDAPGNVRLRIGKPDVYMVGQYELHYLGKGEERSKDMIGFGPTKGCPGEKTAARTLLADEKFKYLMEGTRWPAILAKKSR